MLNRIGLAKPGLLPESDAPDDPASRGRPVPTSLGPRAPYRVNRQRRPPHQVST